MAFVGISNIAQRNLLQAGLSRNKKNRYSWSTQKDIIDHCFLADSILEKALFCSLYQKSKREVLNKYCANLSSFFMALNEAF